MGGSVRCSVLWIPAVTQRLVLGGFNPEQGSWMCCGPQAAWLSLQRCSWSCLPAFHLGRSVFRRGFNPYQSLMAPAPQNCSPAAWIFILFPTFNPTICRAAPVGFLCLCRTKCCYGEALNDSSCHLLSDRCSHFVAGWAVLFVFFFKSLMSLPASN